MIGIAAGSPSSTASAALAGSDSRYPAIPRKLFGRHQCARTIGHVSGGILRTSPTSREITDSPRPLLSLAIHWGTTPAAAHQQRERGPHHSDARQQRPASGKLHPQAEHPRVRRRCIQPFVRRQRVHQNQSRDVARILGRVSAHQHPAEGMPDQNVWRRNLRRFEQRVQFIDDRRCRSRRLRRIAPAQPRAIIAASASKSRHLRANLRPVQAGGGNARLKDHRRPVRAPIDQMPIPAADLDHAPRRWIAPPIGRRSRGLINHSSQNDRKMRNKMVSRIHDFIARRAASSMHRAGVFRPPGSLASSQRPPAALSLMRRSSRLPRLPQRGQFLLLIRCQDLIDLRHRRASDRRQLTHLAAFGGRQLLDLRRVIGLHRRP